MNICAFTPDFGVLISLTNNKSEEQKEDFIIIFFYQQSSQFYINAVIIAHLAQALSWLHLLFFSFSFACCLGALTPGEI